MMRSDDLGIVIAHCGRANNHMRVAYVLSVVAFREIDTQLLQTISCAGTFRVRARDSKAQIHQHLGDTRHADAANADKMNMLNATEHVFGQ